MGERHIWLVAGVRQDAPKTISAVAYVFDNERAAGQCWDRLALTRNVIELSAPVKVAVRKEF